MRGAARPAARRLRDPPVAERVALVTCPFRAYLHLHTDAERLAALRAALRAARAGRAARVRRLRTEPRPTSARPTAAGSSASRGSGSGPTGSPSAAGSTSPSAASDGETTMALAWLPAREWRRLLDRGRLRGRSSATAGSTAARTGRRGHRLGRPPARLTAVAAILRGWPAAARCGCRSTTRRGPIHPHEWRSTMWMISDIRREVILPGACSRKTMAKKNGLNDLRRGRAGRGPADPRVAARHGGARRGLPPRTSRATRPGGVPLPALPPHRLTGYPA